MACTLCKKIYEPLEKTPYGKVAISRTIEDSYILYLPEEDEASSVIQIHYCPICGQRLN